MRRRQLLMLLGSAALPAAALPAMASCAAGGDGDEPGTAGADKITVGVIPILDVAPIYLGKQKGFFSNRKIDLTLALAQGGAAIVPAVLSKQYQFGFSNVISLLLAHSRNLPVRVVCNGTNSTGVDGTDFAALMVKGDSPIQSPAELAGKTVATNTLSNIVDTSVRASVRKAGGDPKAVKFVEMPFPNQPAALQAGQVDAIFVVEPFQQAVLAQGGRKIASSYVDAAPNLVVALYFTHQDLITGNPDLVRRFTEAMKESLAYADTHPDEARQIIGTYTQIAPDVIAKMTLPKWPADINRPAVDALAGLALGDGLLTAPANVGALLP